MNLRLSLKDIELITFLGRYKQMKAIDCKKIYKSKEYYLKRLKVLEKERYIKRENRYYIKVDIEGRKLLNEFGYDNYNICRNKDYQERIKDVIKIATLTLGTDIEFTPSWELKEKQVYTDLGRKYIGELKYMQKTYIVYYISSRNTPIYYKQIVADITKMYSYDNVIVFLEKFNIINKRNKYFVFGNESTQIINPTEENLEMIQRFENIDMYDVLKLVYKEKEILLSNWSKADYMTEDRKYIILMPFIDTEKLQTLNVFYRDIKEIDRTIDILTLRENKETINEILIKNTNIIEIDQFVEKIENENMLKICYLCNDKEI